MNSRIRRCRALMSSIASPSRAQASTPEAALQTYVRSGACSRTYVRPYFLPMSRTRVRWGRIAALCLGAVLSAGLLAGRAGAGPTRPSSVGHLYLVQHGDTVWRIAGGLAGRGDP